MGKRVHKAIVTPSVEDVMLDLGLEWDVGGVRSTKGSRVIGYIRVSTDRQADSGLSLEAQRAKLTAYAAALDLTLVAIIEDAGESAKTLDRPGLARALEMLTAGAADGLLIPKLDRLTRSVRDLADLIERYFSERPTVRSCSLLSVQDSIDTRTAAGRLVLNVLVSVGQWEREAIGERTRDALQALKARGVRLGAPALEGAAVERVHALRAEGATLEAIAEALTTEGHATKRGGKWAKETVRLILARAA
jgi:site-specific DNA recombinase